MRDIFVVIHDEQNVLVTPVFLDAFRRFMDGFGRGARVEVWRGKDSCFVCKELSDFMELGLIRQL
jgi:hypothetical protein